MPITLPPTDEELIASFTPQEREFYEWEEATKEEQWAMRSGASLTFVRSRFPDRKLRKQYFAWCDKWYGRSSARLNHYVSPKEYFAEILATDFRNPAARGSLLWKMEMGNMPFCYLGQGNFNNVDTCFGLKPGTNLLHPNIDGSPKDLVELVDPFILGINTNVPINFNDTRSALPGDRRHQNRSSGDESVRSGNSDDIVSPTGFIFAQLGALCYFNGPMSWEEACDEGEKSICDGPWTMTRYAVVARLNAQFRAEGVYLIYSYYEPDQVTGEIKHTSTQDMKAPVDLPRIRALSKRAGPEQASLFKIADSLRDLGEEKVLKLEALRVMEHQLVRVKEDGINLIRQWVEE